MPIHSSAAPLYGCRTTPRVPQKSRGLSRMARTEQSNVVSFTCSRIASRVDAHLQLNSSPCRWLTVACCKVGSAERFETVCFDCPDENCTSCNITSGDMPACEAPLVHTTAAEPGVNLETLDIDAGY